MLIPVGESWVQELVVLTKRNGLLERQEIVPVRFVPIADAAGYIDATRLPVQRILMV